MTHYAWTIKFRGREDIRHVTTLAGLYEALRALELPGLAPPAFVTASGEIPDHGHYTTMKAGVTSGASHGQGSMTHR